MPDHAAQPKPLTVAELAHAAAAFALPAGTLYLDCAAQGPRLKRVLAAGHAALDASSTPWRYSNAAWEAQVEALRCSVAALLFYGDAEGVAMVPSVAHGIATAARNLPLAAGEGVLVLDGQFPSNLLPWQQRCAETGARVVAARRQDGQDWTEAVLAVLDTEARMRIVALPQAQWRDGTLLDLDRIAARVRELGAALVLDLSQSLGVLPVDLARWQPDFIAAVGHKWLLGPTGLGWLWAAPRWRDTGVAIEQHWTARAPGHDWHFPSGVAPRYAEGARRFDAGGVADAPRLAMAQAAVAQLQTWQLPRVAQRLAALTATLDTALEARGLGAWTTPGHAPHLTALRPPPPLVDALADALQQAGIVCTQRHGVLRIAPHLHVDADGMRRLAGVAARVAGR